jgi:hypothetical protein
MTLEDVDQLASMEEQRQEGVFDEPRQPRAFEARRAVEHGTRGSGDGDASLTSLLPSRKSAPPVYPDPARPTVARNRHLGPVRPPPDEPPQRGGRKIAEDRARAACQHGRRGELDPRLAAVADGVDAGMDPVETADAEALVDGLLAEADGEQLLTGDVSMLVGR